MEKPLVITSLPLGSEEQNGRYFTLLLQVGQYHQYLVDNHTAFHEGPAPVQLKSCAYLHNYFTKEGDSLLDDSFRLILEQFPAFTADEMCLF